MSKIIYITGGARSGKSVFAQELAMRSNGPVGYIATAVAFDEEMRQRIRHHQDSRPKHWMTYERNRDLAGLLTEAPERVFLMDCVTVWLTNMMMEFDESWENPRTEWIDQAQNRAIEEMEQLIAAARTGDRTLLLVSNELGMGLVPVYAFGRVFRDIAGRVNQHIAALADEAYFLVSGIPMRLK